MSSDKDGVANHLSPVSSPSPQVKQQTGSNLTGVARKVKDLAADFHNLILKWNTLNSKAMEIITKIANIKIEKVFNVAEMEGNPVTVTLPLELNPLCDLLTDTVEAMGAIEAKMQQKVKAAEGLVSLQQFQKDSKSDFILFSSMTIEDVANTVQEIQIDFTQELQFKRELCKIVAHADSRDTIMFYSTSWMHQPYIRPQCQDLLEALLIETGHVK